MCVCVCVLYLSTVYIHHANGTSLVEYSREVIIQSQSLLLCASVPRRRRRRRRRPRRRRRRRRRRHTPWCVASDTYIFTPSHTSSRRVVVSRLGASYIPRARPHHGMDRVRAWAGRPTTIRVYRVGDRPQLGYRGTIAARAWRHTSTDDDDGR